MDFPAEVEDMGSTARASVFDSQIHFLLDGWLVLHGTALWMAFPELCDMATPCDLKRLNF